MPSYLYECKRCGRELEREQRITDAPLRKCPHCKHNTLRRLIAGAGTFLLQGPGWFNTGGY